MPSIDPVSGGLELIQGVIGIGESIAGNIKANRLVKQLKAFQTPAEASKILNATESNASQGFDAFTLNYMTNQTNKAAANTLATATRLNADPNTLSALLDQQTNNLMKIGAENHAENMKNFGQYLNALQMMGQNKEAEWASQQNLIKDKIQQATQQKGEGVQNFGNAANAFIGTQSAARIADLYSSDVNTTIENASKSVNKVRSRYVQTGTNPDGSPKFGK